MNRFEPVVDKNPHELEGLLRQGRRVDPEALEGWLWHGLSLGLAPPLFALFGRFGKTFHRETSQLPGRDPASVGGLRGWNVRMRQKGVEGWVPLTFRGRTVTYGFYDVLPEPRGQLSQTYPEAFLIDYGRAGNRAWDPLGRVRDWVVGVEDDLLLGRMYLSLGGRNVPTPSYFALARGERLTEIAVPPAFRG
jgi:hypothetical protein